MINENRLFSLDYLRGLSAFAIMIYHYYTWLFGHPSSETLLGRLGVYGVSIFYILSGITLYLVYNSNEKFNTLNFFVKRIFRIFPLLWLATISTIILQRAIPDWYKVFINLSGLFGFIDWSNYFATGVWSIGNELTFYALFPVIIFANKRYKYGFQILLAISGSLFFYFAFFIVSPHFSWEENWRNYINPLNQCFLFLLGITIAKYFNKFNLNYKNSVPLILIGFCLLILYPATSSKIDLISNVNRLIFTLSSFLICLGFFKLNLKLPSFLHLSLATTGEISYSIYLIHPLVFSVIGAISTFFYFTLSPIIKLFISVILTFIISYFIYSYFEKYFMVLGSKIAKYRNSTT